MEEWRDVIGYECLYEVSSEGQIRSKKRTVIRKNGRSYAVNQNVLKPSEDGCGYYRTALSGKGKLKTVKVHRIVAAAFVGEITEGLEVNHINGNKKDNRATNLELVTRSENVRHAFKIGLARPMRGSDNPTAIIDEAIARDIKMLLGHFSCSKIAKYFEISIHIVKDISRGRTWAHV
jgi:hypothetical protein